MSDKNSDDCCEIKDAHIDVLSSLRPMMNSDEDYYNLSEFFKVFGDSTRTKIIHLLSLKEICVCDISELTGMSQSATSHQLKILRQFKIVKARKEGKQVFYSLTDKHVEHIFNEGLKHILE